MSVTRVMVDPHYNNRRNRQRIDDAEKELEELTKSTQAEPEKELAVEPEPSDPEEKSFKKRYGDLRRHMSEKEKEWEVKFESLKASVQTTQVLPPKSDEDIAAWAKKYPDVASIVETIATKKAEEKLSTYKNKFDEYEKVTQDTIRQKALNEISKVHPDFDELRKSDKFHEWAEEQPKWVQDALYENEDDARAVSRVLDLYKSDMGLTSSARKSQSKEVASLVTSKNKANMDFEESGAKILESQVARMSAQDYEKNEKKIMEAIRKGNFVYDISGGAR